MRSAALGEDDEAADVVGGDLLQAEAEADAERAAEHRQRRQVDADRRQREHQADEQQQRAQRRWRRSCAATGRWPLPFASSRRSIAAETQSASTSTTPAVMRALDEVAQRDLRRRPSSSCTSSIASSISGSTPVTQSTTAIQASHEMLRSMVRTQRHAGKRAAQHAHAEADDDQREQDRDRDPEHRRLDTSPRARRAPRYAKREREHREQHAVDDALAEPDRSATGGSRPRSRRTTSQAATRQPASTASSASAPGCVSARSELVELAGGRTPRRPSSGRRAPAAGSDELDAGGQHRAGARRRCAPARRGCSRLRGTRRCGRRRAARRPP